MGITLRILEGDLATGGVFGFFIGGENLGTFGEARGDGMYAGWKRKVPVITFSIAPAARAGRWGM
jgi:hypothetical protein